MTAPAKCTCDLEATLPIGDSVGAFPAARGGWAAVLRGSMIEHATSRSMALAHLGAHLTILGAQVTELAARGEGAPCPRHIHSVEPLMRIRRGAVSYTDGIDESGNRPKETP